jgi:hypothetical protein
MTAIDTDPLKIKNLVPSRGLTPDVEEWIVDGLVAALPGLKMETLFALRRDMFREADLITLATEPSGGTVVGALSSRWCAYPSGGEFLHILTQFVGERYQGGAAFAGSWGGHFTRLYSEWSRFPGLFVLKTYNPIVYCAMRAFTRVPGVTFYPDVRLARQDEPTMEMAEQVAAAISPDHVFIPETGIIRGAGEPRDLYPALPESKNQRVNDYFAATTVPGDRMLCMLSVPTPEAAGMILGAFGARPADGRIHLALAGSSQPIEA